MEKLIYSAKYILDFKWQKENDYYSQKIPLEKIFGSMIDYKQEDGYRIFISTLDNQYDSVINDFLFKEQKLEKDYFYVSCENPIDVALICEINIYSYSEKE